MPVTRSTRFIPQEVVTLESNDGFLRYDYVLDRHYVAKRFRETKEIHIDFSERLGIWRALSQIGNATICGALWACFGPPQDIYDSFKQSYSFCFDVIVQRQLRDPQFKDPITLMLEFCEWKEGADFRLRMPRRHPEDNVIEDGKDILTPEMRRELLCFMIGFIQGYAETGRLQDFNRAYPGGEYSYGVKDGIPFDEKDEQKETK